MSTRTFTDDDGIEWTVWSVSPIWVDRRAGRERRVKDVQQHEDAARERRAGDRRRGLGDSGPRIRISPNLTGGWLAFEGQGRRRRVSPIPPGWEAMSDAELARLCAKGTEVPVSRRRLIE